MRKQRAFASLTEAEIEKIAEWLRHETYDAILERVRKPRPEGFGLDISRSPLATLHAKTNRVERINNRIAFGQRLTLAEFDAIQAGEKADVAEEIHDAIMDETHAMATSGENTPTQLLALQRLADFPARAEYREHKRQLELRKEERDQQKQAHKVQMDLQKTTHKIQMDLEKAVQKKEMDEHRKRMAEERLALAQRSLELREKQLAAKSASSESAIRDPQSAMSDDLGPLATTYEEIRARARAKFGTRFTAKRSPEALQRTDNGQLTTDSAPENSSSAPSPSAVNSPLAPSTPLTPVQSVIENDASLPVSAPSAPLREINILPVTNTTTT